MEYFHQHEQYHGSGADLKYEFPQKTRPFAVPEPFWPAREAKAGERRHYDVIIVSDFRFKGGSTLSSIEEINAHLAANLRTGLLQMSRYDHDPDTRMNLKVRETLVHPNVDVIVYGEKVSCDLLIVRYPPVLQELQRFVPDIDAKNIRVIINQTPMSDYGKDGVLRYDIPRCAAHLQHYFGKSATWHPIGPAVRETLYKYHADGLSAINFSSEDWVNIIDVDEWQRSKRPERNKRPRIGRHSRDHIVKWPESKHELLQIYPDSDKYEVAILGGAKIARSVLGRIPSNWRVLGFNEITPKNFLAELDVFIYYTHSGWIESFGRVIIEAMASGVPVIVPHAYKALFREAALYAEPKDVLSLVDKLMKDPDHYENRVQIGLEYVRQNFGYEKHMERVGWLIGRNLTVPSNEVPQEFLSSRVLKR